MDVIICEIIFRRLFKDFIVLGVLEKSVNFFECWNFISEIGGIVRVRILNAAFGIKIFIIVHVFTKKKKRTNLVYIYLNYKNLNIICRYLKQIVIVTNICDLCYPLDISNSIESPK